MHQGLIDCDSYNSKFESKCIFLCIFDKKNGISFAVDFILICDKCFVGGLFLRIFFFIFKIKAKNNEIKKVIKVLFKNLVTLK